MMNKKINIGNKVKVSNPTLPPAGNGCHPVVGTIGEVSKIEKGWHIVKFKLPLIDLRGSEWMATQYRQEIEQAYIESELEVIE